MRSSSDAYVRMYILVFLTIVDWVRMLNYNAINTNYIILGCGVNEWKRFRQSCYYISAEVMNIDDAMVCTLVAFPCYTIMF